MHNFLSKTNSPWSAPPATQGDPTGHAAGGEQAAEQEDGGDSLTLESLHSFHAIYSALRHEAPSPCQVSREGEVPTAYYPAEATVPRTPTQIIIEAGFSKDKATRSFPGAVPFQMKSDK